MAEMTAWSRSAAPRSGSTHVLMILGVLVIFFPIWLAFVASTVTQPEIVRPPMPLLPGDRFWENYRSALVSGVNVPVAPC
jgi:sn-glycerol 3-phosphate transport system permease protein